VGSVNQNLACFARGKDGELLISNAVDAGGPERIFLLPMRKAVVDDGHLRMAYWENNERMKGGEIELNDPCVSLLCASERSGDNWAGAKLEAGKNSFTMKTEGTKGPFTLEDLYMVAVIRTFETEAIPDAAKQGIVIDCDATVTANPHTSREDGFPNSSRWPSLGFYVEESDGALAFTLEAGTAYRRRSYVEKIVLTGNAENPVNRAVVDETGEGCASQRGIDANRPIRLKLFVFDNVIELYADGMFVQTFVNLAPPTGRIGFIAKNACAKVENLKIFKTNLN